MYRRQPINELFKFRRNGVIWLPLLLAGLACGLKAAPQPRESVVPSPVNKLVVDIVPQGIRLAFNLPAKSLDGSSLEEIGGYRILRRGPDGEVIREEVCYSVSERRKNVGKSIVFLDRPPEDRGIYHYSILPFDAYGSHPSLSNSAVEFYWEGLK